MCGCVGGKWVKVRRAKKGEREKLHPSTHHPPTHPPLPTYLRAHGVQQHHGLAPPAAGHAGLEGGVEGDEVRPDAVEGGHALNEVGGGCGVVWGGVWGSVV